mgnify:CR=1 FL=1
MIDRKGREPKIKKTDFSKIEKKWQRQWEKEGIFETDIDSKRKKFFFTTPYPYISGSLHIGHGRAVIESDIYTRYKRMKGFNVLYPMAFHISGTPVLGISSAIKNGDKDKIELYESYVSAYEKDKAKVKKIVQSFESTEKLVDFFIPKMMSEYKQLGIGVDWRRSFTSGDIEHQQMVTWQFEKYNELGYLKKEKYPVLYSPLDQSAMGEDDIVDADSNAVEKQEFTLLKFRFKDKILVAATIRPETIFGQTNLWINPKVEYWEVKVGNDVWIMSKDAIEKLEHQRKDVKAIGKTREDLIGQYARAPGIDREVIILPSRFVDADIGTGIVTSVPSDAPYDYVALKELQENKAILKEYGLNREKVEEIEIIPIIKTAKYGDKAGVRVVEDHGIGLQDDPRLEKLTQEVYKEGFHTGILLENCGEYKGMKVVDAKEKMKKDLIKNGEADIMYETSRKAFSRGGGKIIVAIMDNQWFIDFNSKGWKAKANECLAKMDIVPENFRKQFEDTFAWLDKRPCARKRGLGTLLPFDKDWVIESLSDSTIYMTLYAINHIVKKNKLKREQLNKDFFEYVYLGKGDLKEVSKKTEIKESILKECRESFDYWMPVDHRHTFSLHLSNHLSFMIFAFSALFNEKYWPKKITFHGLVVSEGSKMSKSKGNTITLLKVKENYGADTFRFYMTYSSNIEGTFDWRENEANNAKETITRLFDEMSEAIKQRKKGDVKELYTHKFNKIKKIAGEKLDEMKLREYNAAVVFDMLKAVKNAKLAMDKKELSHFYDLIIEDWIRMIMPITPHIAEELWSKLGKKGFVSLESWPTVDESKINDKFDLAEKVLETTVGDILNILKIIKEKQDKEGEKVYLYVIPKELENYNAEELSKRIGLTTKVFAVNDPKKYDPQDKAAKAKFGKPAIYIE